MSLLAHVAGEGAREPRRRLVGVALRRSGLGPVQHQQPPLLSLLAADSRPLDAGGGVLGALDVEDLGLRRRVMVSVDMVLGGFDV